MRYHTEDPPRERYESIEKKPEDYYPHLATHLPPMKLEMPILEKQIAEKGMHPNEKSESESPKRKSKKVHLKPKRSAVAKIQKKL